MTLPARLGISVSWLKLVEDIAAAGRVSVMLRNGSKVCCCYCGTVWLGLMCSWNRPIKSCDTGEAVADESLGEVGR